MNKSTLYGGICILIFFLALATPVYSEGLNPHIYDSSKNAHIYDSSKNADNDKPDKCNDIEIGMTQVEVKQILGSPFHNEIYPGDGSYKDAWTYTDCGIVVTFRCNSKKCRVIKINYL